MEVDSKVWSCALNDRPADADDGCPPKRSDISDQKARPPSRQQEQAAERPVILHRCDRRRSGAGAGRRPQRSRNH
jgi:hypothetical protein